MVAMVAENIASSWLFNLEEKRIYSHHSPVDYSGSQNPSSWCLCLHLDHQHPFHSTMGSTIVSWSVTHHFLSLDIVMWPYLDSGKADWWCPRSNSWQWNGRHKTFMKQLALPPCIPLQSTKSQCMILWASQGKCCVSFNIASLLPSIIPT